MTLTNRLAITFVVLHLNQVEIQMEPLQGWITNNAGSLTIPQGMPIRHDSHVGPTVRIDWAPTTNVVLQQSADLSVWYDVPVRFINSSGWMAYPAAARYYRLRRG